MVGEAVNLEYKMAKGEVLIYRSIVHSDQAVKEEETTTTQSSDLLMNMDQEAKEVRADGLMDVEVTITGGKTKVGAEETELPNAGQVILMTMKKNGEIIKSSVEIPFSQPPFPSKPVKKGDSWKEQSKITIPGKAEPAVLFYEYTVLGMASTGGYNCVEIGIKCDETRITLAEGIDQTIKAIGKTYFASKEGRLVRSEVETLTQITGPNLLVDNKIKVLVELVEVKPAPFTSVEQGFIVK